MSQGPAEFVRSLFFPVFHLLRPPPPTHPSPPLLLSQGNNFDTFNQPNGYDAAGEWLFDDITTQWPTYARFTHWDARRLDAADETTAWDADVQPWDTYNLSLALLDNYDAHADVGRYTSFVWNDTSLRFDVPTALVSGDLFDLLELLGALAPLLTATTTDNSSSSSGLDVASLLDVLGGLNTTNLPVPEIMQLLGVTAGEVSVMHNSSTKHALPSAITDHVRRLMFLQAQRSDPTLASMPAASCVAFRGWGGVGWGVVVSRV
jgi:hypothetical protein